MLEKPKTGPFYAFDDEKRPQKDRQVRLYSIENNTGYMYVSYWKIIIFVGSCSGDS